MTDTVGQATRSSSTTSTETNSIKIKAVLFDFGGVIADGPFEAFARYERANGLPEGFVRHLNSTNHHDNAWARLERNEVGFDEFCELFETEAKQAGGSLDARELMATLSGTIRPEMLEAVRRCSERFSTALLTNNFLRPPTGSDTVDTARGAENESHIEQVLGLFDIVIESAKVGVRKPDPRFYMLACDALGIAPPQAVFLDDLGINLKPARELGMLTIKVEAPDAALTDLESVVGFPLR